MSIKSICRLRINNPILDDELFYHIYIKIFLHDFFFKVVITISSIAIIKAKNIAHIGPPIIQKTKLTNYSIIKTETSEVILPGS